MNKKHFYTAFVSCAIALNAIPLHAEENSNQDTSKTIFVCSTETETPTMFAYTPGAVNLTPLMSWHQEYLLPKQSGTEICQQTATKLQDSYQQEQAKYFKAEKQEKSNLVCLVSEENQDCNSEDSEKLFSINPKYDPGCILDNREPLECMAVGNVRGGVYSVVDEPYQPLWWPW